VAAGSGGAVVWQQEDTDMKNKIWLVLVLVTAGATISGCEIFDGSIDQIPLERDEGGSGY